MANTRSGNVWYVDTAYAATTDNLSGSVMVTGGLVTSTGASGRIVLADASTGATKIDFRVAATDSNASGETRPIPLPEAVMFPNGIKVSTLTTAVATIFVKDAGKATN